ncbi:hypothetical protein Tco_0664587 [Tanacetum coccineum]
METKDTLSSCSDLDEQEIQQLKKQAKILKENSLNKLNALHTTTQHLSSSNNLMYYTFRDAFHRLFEADKRTFRSVLSRNIQNLESQLNKETLHEKDSNSDLRVIKVQFDKFIHSKVLEPSNYNSYDLETRRDFKEYTHMEAQTFKETIIQNMNSIEQCIVERANHEQELQNGLKRLNERKLQIQECKVQEVKASDASSGDNDCSRIVSDKGNDQGLENQSNTSGDDNSRPRNECNDKSTSGDDTDIRPSYDIEPMVEVPYTAEYNVFVVDTQHFEQPECIINTRVVEKVDSNVIPESPDMCDNDPLMTHMFWKRMIAIGKQKDFKAIKESKRIIDSKLKECNSKLEEYNKALRESTSTRDSCLIALQNKQTELEKYKSFNDQTVAYDKLQTKLNETLGLLARKDIDIKEGLKTKAYEISIVNQKHIELVKKSLLTKLEFEGLLKEKTKVISDLKVKEGKYIDKMIEMDKQIKFLNEILYKRNQSIQTIHMLAPKCAKYNGRSTFANPKYLKIVQSEKQCLYEIPYDTSDPTNRFAPNGEETVTLANESRLKLNKDTVKPYDYTYENSLYEIFKPPSQTYLDQLEHAKEVRKTMWRKTFVRKKPNIAKNVAFLPVSKSISKSRQVYNEMTNNMNHFRTICKQAWSNHTNNSFHNPTAKF